MQIDGEITLRLSLYDALALNDVLGSQSTAGMLQAGLTLGQTQSVHRLGDALQGVLTTGQMGREDPESLSDREIPNAETEIQ